MQETTVRLVRFLVGGALLISGALQLFGLPGDVPSWASFINDHGRDALSLGLIALGVLVIIDPRRMVERWWPAVFGNTAEASAADAEERATLEAELAAVNEGLQQARKNNESLDAIAKDFKSLTKERDQLNQALRQSIEDRRTLGYQLSARDAQIEALKAGPPRAPFDGTLEQFVKAWLDPAWDLALRRLVSIRQEMERTNGYQSQLLQRAVIEPATLAKSNVNRWMQHDNDAPSESFDALVTAMYRSYESIVEHINRGSEAVGWFWVSTAPRELGEWASLDEKTCDRLRELTAASEFANSQIYRACREVIEGGAGKIHRDRIIGHVP